MSALKPAPIAHLCPFCHEPVAPKVLAYGGHCPHCLIEIPGEEAPTDPGLPAAAPPPPAAPPKKRWPIAVGAAVLLVAGGVGAWLALKPAPPADTAPTTTYKIPPLSIHPETKVRSAEAPVNAAANNEAPAFTPDTGARGAGSTRKADTGGPSIYDDEELPDLSPNVPVATSPQQSRQAASPTVDTVKMPSLGGGIPSLASQFAVPGLGGPTTRGPEGRVLESDEEISGRISAVLRHGTSQFRACYERSLKGAPGFGGSWTLSFTVSTAGAATDVGVTANAGGDAEFEACIANTVGDLEFGRISRPWGVDLPLEFVPR